MGYARGHSYRLVKSSMFVLAAIACAAILLTVGQTPKKTEAVNPVCPTGYTIYSPSINATAPSTVSGTIQLALNYTQATSLVVDGVEFMVDGQNVLGRAVQQGTSPYYWTMPWNTALLPNGPHPLMANVHHTSGMVCSVNVIPPVSTLNSVLAHLGIAQILPVTSWTGPTNTNADFEVVPTLSPNTSTDMRPYMQFVWTTTVGLVTPAPTRFVGRLSSGPTAASGQVSVKVMYGGQSAIVNIPITVISPTVPTGTAPVTTTNPDGSTTTSPAGTSPTPTSTTAPNTPTLTTQYLISDSAIKQCLQKTLSAERIAAIESEQSRPTPAEFEAYQACFAKRSFVVASTLAPVAPAAVKDVKESKKVEINGATNAKIKTDIGETQSLVFKGKGEPNKTVLLYVFSEPLVLATTTDANGEWSYTLEDPLAPGDHEAYALVSKGDNTYERSSPFGFLIGKAEASASNPQGYSLALQIQPTATTNNRTTNMFIAGIIFVVVFSLSLLAVYFGIRMHGNKTTPAQTQSGNNDQPPFSGVM